MVLPNYVCNVELHILSITLRILSKLFQHFSFFINIQFFFHFLNTIIMDYDAVNETIKNGNI